MLEKQNAENIAGVISTLRPGKGFLFPPTDFCLGISTILKKQVWKQKALYVEKKKEKKEVF